MPTPLTAPSPVHFMSRAVKPLNSNTEWGSRYAGTLRRIVYEHAAASPRSVQQELGPSEIGSPCDRQVVGKLAGIEATNHIVDPWASIVGTAIHMWMAEAFKGDNLRYDYVRWLAEFRVHPHPDHPGTGDLYDFFEVACVDHKGLHTDTPIPTPQGWTSIGKLRVGDLVFGDDGKPYPVTNVYPATYKPCYRVSFKDGGSIITDNIQEWVLKTGVGKNIKSEILSTEQASKQIWHKSTRPQRRLRVSNADPLVLPSRKFITHPYVLGVWLGDGHCCGGVISKPDDELYTHIKSCGYKVSQPHGQRKMNRTVYGLATELQKLGLLYPYEGPIKNHHSRLSGHKAIPYAYLRGSQQQRLELLQGLMDTDGTWNKPRNQAVFTTTDKNLADSVHELVTSLGWKAKTFTHKAHGFGVTTTAYHVTYTPYGANPFKLSRKANLVRLNGTTRAHYRTIDTIEPTVTVPTRCIDVASPNHLYLAGVDMMPVHNCLGETTLNELRTQGPPQHYYVQLLAYARGFRLMGLPVRRIVIVAWPRTKSTLDPMYVWDHELTPEDDVLLDEIFKLMVLRKAMAAGVRAGQLTLNDITPTPSDSHCIFCPFFRTDVLHDPTATGCAGHHLLPGRMKG